MRRAQSMELVTIVILMVIAIMFIVFNKIAASSDRINSIEKTSLEYKETFLLTSTNKIPYLTRRGVSVQEMLSVYVCYQIRNANYGTFGMDVIAESIKAIDMFYGTDRWKLELESSYCLDSFGITHNICSIDEDYIAYEFSMPLSCREDLANGKILIKK